MYVCMKMESVNICWIWKYIHWKLSNMDTLSTKESFIVKCPDFNYTQTGHLAFGTTKEDPRYPQIWGPQ